METVESAYLRIMKTLSMLIPADDDQAGCEAFFAGFTMEVLRVGQIIGCAHMRGLDYKATPILRSGMEAASHADWYRFMQYMEEIRNRMDIQPIGPKEKWPNAWWRDLPHPRFPPQYDQFQILRQLRETAMKKSIGQLLTLLKVVTGQMAQRETQMKEVLSYCDVLLRAEDKVRAKTDTLADLGQPWDDAFFAEDVQCSEPEGSQGKETMA